MTQFTRRTHQRTNQNGLTFWVGEHQVVHDDFGRESSSDSQEVKSCRNYLYEQSVDVAWAGFFSKPNACCPVCQKPVYFYRNDHGSRVYFDDLGKPWPKHGCFIDPDIFRESDGVGEEGPVMRDASEIRTIRRCFNVLDHDPTTSFSQRYNLAPWTPYVISRRVSVSSALVYLIVSPLEDLNADPVIFLAPKLPRSLSRTSLLFYFKGWISYFDTTTLEVVDIEVKRVKSLKTFIRDWAKI